MKYSREIIALIIPYLPPIDGDINEREKIIAQTMKRVPLEMKIEIALLRIKDLYDKTNGKCILSFSGGKDSTIVAELYLMAKGQGIIGDIDILFADTGVEYDAIYDFVEWFGQNKQEVIYLKPSMPFGAVLKKYGKPAMSKIKSDWLHTIHRNGAENPTKTIRGQNLLGTGEFKTKSHSKLANKHYHFLHKDIEYDVHSKCCHFVKKQPFYNYYKENGTTGYLTGIRQGEGGVRSLAYQSCTSFKKVGDTNMIHKMPIFDWTDNDIGMFIKKYKVKISDAYTKYGLDRTGCIGCPFAKDIYKNLEVLYNYEPNKYKATQHWLGDVYRDLEVELPFDLEYMNKLKERLPIIQKRRYEILKKWKPEIAEKWNPNK